jgi:hypothetical protein
MKGKWMSIRLVLATGGLTALAAVLAAPGKWH